MDKARQDNDELSRKMTREKNTETSAAQLKKDEEALRESLARLEAQVNLVTAAIALMKRMGPPPKNVPNGEVFKELKKPGYVITK